ncbi:hypothetical protein B0T22DRAFT_477621 [Podospora appendiculata]|uniref:3-hydroxyacyl-CoA dehydrogenase n=1 Tax=Podospora appendiculata TaxID=314037 RepID=A0AAE0XK46_9PEZI|nr:hypothetical protein B0T22DRAFT_477621 [Podospora appendiculata]
MAPWALPTTSGRPVCILGAGVLGRRIGACWASTGYAVHIRDTDPKQIAGAREYIKHELWRYNPTLAVKNIIVEGFQELAPALDNAWLVIECVPEKLDLKVAVFAELEKLAPADAILATNSSSYKSREMTARVKPETARRMLNVHYIVPPDIRAVELMTSGSTHEAIFPFLQQHLRLSGMLPVTAHVESTGFIINRVWAAIKRECLMVLAEGVASPVELDFIWAEMFTKNPTPPCALMDSVGLDTVALIEQHYIEERHLEDRGVLPFLHKYIAAGRLGAKSSKGGLYPPGHTTKTATNDVGHHDNLHAPAIYFLDLGLAASPTEAAFNRGRILVGSADGKSPLRTVVANQPMPDGLALCPAAGKLFWSNMGIPSANDGSIMSCNLDGSAIRVLVPPGAVHTPKQLAIDDGCRTLYFADREGMRVLRCAVDGSGLETLVQTGDWRTADINDKTRWCVGIAVAPRAQKFYWSQKGPSKGNQGRIFRAGIEMPPGQDASTRTDVEVLLEHLPEPIDLEIDEEGGALYWTDRGELPTGNSLNRAEVGGEGGVLRNHQILARNLHEAIGLAIDKTNRHIYVTEIGGAVYRFNMDGSDKRKFYEDQGAFAGIALCDV